MLLLRGERAIEKMKKSLDLFAESDDSIVAVVMPQNAILDHLERLDDGLWEKYEEIAKGIGVIWKNCIYDPEGTSEKYIDRFDAFYGDPGVIARKFVLKKKPVMIQNYDI